MEVFMSRFPHITEQVFDQLDGKSLKNCREISKVWQARIDERNISWIQIVKIPKVLQSTDVYQW